MQTPIDNSTVVNQSTVAPNQSNPSIESMKCLSMVVLTSFSNTADGKEELSLAYGSGRISQTIRGTYWSYYLVIGAPAIYAA